MRRRAKVEGPLAAAAGAAVVSAAVAAGAAMAPLAAADPRPATLTTPGPLPSLLSPSSSSPGGYTSTAPQPTLAPAPTAPPAGALPRPAAPRAAAASPTSGAGGGSESANQTLQKYMTAHDDPTFRLGKGTLFVEHCRTAHCVRSSVTIDTGYAGVVTYTFWIDAAPSPTPSK